MNDYREVRLDISPCCETATDLMAAFLADIGFESFVPDEKGLTAYIPEQNFDPDALRDVISSFPMEAHVACSDVKVEGRDWNEEWEKNYFKPIVVGEKCVIHSTFHKDVPPAEYDIVIDPKMAFGTGHHSTTSLILGYLLSMNLEGKSVIDMGTGTGILAILAMMRGAASATGIEIDPMAYENALCNVRLNAQDVKLICGDAAALQGCGEADLLIANINRNIVLADMAAYAGALKHGGTMLLSGFFEQDIPLLKARGTSLGLTLEETRTRTPEDNPDQTWAAIRFVKAYYSTHK